MTDRAIFYISLVAAISVCAIFGASGAAFFFGIFLMLEFADRTIMK